MAKSEPIEIEATVTTALPNAMFKLKLDNSDHEILGIVSGKMANISSAFCPVTALKCSSRPTI